MADEIGTGLHGVPIRTSPWLPGHNLVDKLLEKFLDAGNVLRYGVTEPERMKMVNSLSAPGVRDVAYIDRGEPGQIGYHKEFDPAAAERYTSAYLFGKRYPLGEGEQMLAHEISGPSRELMNAMGVPGVGEERPELTRAEYLGMKRGAGERNPEGLDIVQKLARLFK